MLEYSSSSSSFFRFCSFFSFNFWSWGYGEFGQLGIGKLDEGEDVQSRPIKVDILNGINQVRSANDEPKYQNAKVLKVAGGSHSSALIAI